MTVTTDHPFPYRLTAGPEKTLFPAEFLKGNYCPRILVPEQLLAKGKLNHATPEYAPTSPQLSGLQWN